MMKEQQRQKTLGAKSTKQKKFQKIIFHLLVCLLLFFLPLWLPQGLFRAPEKIKEPGLNAQRTTNANNTKNNEVKWCKNYGDHTRRTGVVRQKRSFIIAPSGHAQNTVTASSSLGFRLPCQTHLQSFLISIIKSLYTFVFYSQPCY